MNECPICRAPVDPAHSTAVPFCSSRCQQIDLGRWLNEEYGLLRIPDPEDDEESTSDSGEGALVDPPERVPRGFDS